MPAFLVAKGFRQDAAPQVRITGKGGSYTFRFHAPLQEHVLPEQMARLFPARGATGNVRYVRDEARRFLEDILKGAFETAAPRRKTA